MANYSIWLLQTGEMLDFPRSGIFYGRHNSGTLPTPLGFIVLRGEGHLAVIDTGFRTDLQGIADARSYGVSNPHGPEELLPAIGLDPEAVDTVILTHAHWDHAGGLSAFPNATVYLQERELSSWLRVINGPKRFGSLVASISRRDFDELWQRMLADKVCLVNGMVPDLLPGVDLVPSFDTHTWGHQHVVIRTLDGPYVVPGDLVFTFANLEGLDTRGVYVPIGQATGSQETVLAAFDDIMQVLDGDAGRIVPCHDFQAYERYPSREILLGIRVAEVASAHLG